jgi:predicted nuclease with RNAse H fold
VSVSKAAPGTPSIPLALGVDLRSGPRYPTGLAVLGPDRRLRLLRTVRSDEQIEDAVRRFEPAIIAIDAPLALPEGRCCVDPTCACAEYGIMREIDRLCAAAGYRPFPTLLPSMVGLTLRGIALAERLRAQGLAVVEVYPGMAQDILGIPRKRDRDGLRRGLRRAGIRGIPRKRRPTHDELDAATAALVGLLHLESRTETIGPDGVSPLVAPLAPRSAEA